MKWGREDRRGQQRRWGRKGSNTAELQRVGVQGRKAGLERNWDRGIQRWVDTGKSYLLGAGEGSAVRRRK